MRYSVVLVTILLVIAAAPVMAQSAPDAWTLGSLVMRTGPGETYDLVTTLPEGTALALERRDASQSWVWGRALNGTAAGWVAAAHLRYRNGFDPIRLPLPPANPDVVLLQRVPVLPESFSPRVSEIFEQGQALGNRANVFAKVGDCNTDNPVFMVPFDTGNYDLGPYTDLQDTIDYFAGSFAPSSAAGLFGYSSMSVLDPIFADPARCQPGESSVVCEYRRIQPGVAVIMFGANDVVGITPDQYTDSLTQMVDESIARGIIPVLTTFPWCESDRGWETALAMNVSTVEIAHAYEVPLINFWRAAQPLKNCGFAPDTHHLTQSSLPLAFDGDEQVTGSTMRNFLTLNVLDHLRREVLSEQ